VDVTSRRQGFRPETSPSNVPLRHRFDDSASLLRCGARAGRINATWPLAKVTVDGEALRVEGIPTYDIWVERSVVEEVEPIRRFASRGVRFRSGDGRYDGLILWDGRKLRASLARNGWLL
jgi:hypothetical protein